jgi:hypothetical protein
MNAALKKNVESFVEMNITQFHSSREEHVRKIKLKDLLQKKNPYLFRAKDLGSADGLISGLLDAVLSSSEEGKFGTFMEHLAIFVSSETRGGQKAAAHGLDIDFTHDGTRYLVAVKSGDSWGNSSQHKKLKDDFQNALRIVGQHRSAARPQCVLGICYGRFKKTDKGLFIKVGGQDFWELISGDSELYKTIVLPLGHRAKQQNESFARVRKTAQDHLVRQFKVEYCCEDGSIDWERLVELVSKNIQSR